MTDFSRAADLRPRNGPLSEVDWAWAQLLMLLESEHRRGLNNRQDRTGVGTTALFGRHRSFELRREFPLVSLKTVSWKTVWEEMRWMLSGSTNINDTTARIWDEWADRYGDLGPIYGHQWRGRGGPDGKPDQIQRLIDGLRAYPHSRRHVVSAWNPGELAHMALPPCHALFQVFCHNSNEISLQMYQRSCDVFLGLPYNIGGYAFLLETLALLTGRKARGLHITLGDYHLYSNHVEQARECVERFKHLERHPKQFERPTVPKLTWEGDVSQAQSWSIDDFLASGVKPIINGYVGRGKVEAEVAV